MARRKRTILLALIVGAILVNLIFNFWPDSPSSLMASALFKGKYGRLQIYLDIQKFLEENAPEGNVLVLFEGAKGIEYRKPVKQKLMLYYLWCVYYLYPRKVYVGDPRNPITDLRETSTTSVSLDEKVYREYDIRFVVTFKATRLGTVEPEIRAIR